MAWGTQIPGIMEFGGMEHESLVRKIPPSWHAFVFSILQVLVDLMEEMGAVSFRQGKGYSGVPSIRPRRHLCLNWKTLPLDKGFLAHRTSSCKITSEIGRNFTC